MPTCLWSFVPPFLLSFSLYVFLPLPSYFLSFSVFLLSFLPPFFFDGPSLPLFHPVLVSVFPLLSSFLPFTSLSPLLPPPLSRPSCLPSLTILLIYLPSPLFFLLSYTFLSLSLPSFAPSPCPSLLPSLFLFLLSLISFLPFFSLISFQCTISTPLSLYFLNFLSLFLVPFLFPVCLPFFYNCPLSSFQLSFYLILSLPPFLLFLLLTTSNYLVLISSFLSPVLNSVFRPSWLLSLYHKTCTASLASDFEDRETRKMEDRERREWGTTKGE